MKYLFTYGPVPTDKADQVPLKETEIGEIPEDWMSLRIGEFAETTSGGTPSRERQDYYQGDIPWVKSGELGDSHIVITEETITDKALVNSNAKIFPIGTLLLAMYGATAGKVGILEIEAATNQAVCAIFPNEKALSTYLFYSLMYRREELLGERYGGAQPNVSQRVIRLFKLPIPPIDIQTVIYLSLNNIDNKLSAETRRKSALKALFNSLLHYLMTGKLRVQI
jgi:type I restriction enzyme S subunit